MLYVDENYSNYKYLVSASDNYIILTNEPYALGSWDSPDTINIIYQYLKPGYLVIEDRKTYTSNVDFRNISNNISHNWKDRADYTTIICGALIVALITTLIFKGVSKLFVRGGVWF